MQSDGMMRTQVLGSLDENMQRYGDMLTEQQRSVAVSLLSLHHRTGLHIPARLSLSLREELLLELQKRCESRRETQQPTAPATSVEVSFLHDRRWSQR